MQRIISIFLTLSLGPALLAGGPGPDPRIDDRFVVGIADGATALDAEVAIEAAHPLLDVMPLDAVPGRNIHLFGIAPGAPIVAVDALDTDLDANAFAPIITFGEMLYESQAPESKTGSTWVDGLAEVDFQGQYAAATLGLVPAHDRSRGAGIVVAILDTGVDVNHPGLAGTIAAGGFDFVDMTTNVLDRGDGADSDGDGDIDEAVGHGTFTAGLVHRTAPDADLLPVRVLNGDGIGTMWTIARGIYHAIDRGVEVINLSLGSTYDSDLVVRAIAEANLLGIPVVASAGNFDRSDPREFPAMDDIDAGEAGQPHDLPGAFGVAAVDPGDVKADFSNYSRRLVISAPGQSIGGQQIVSLLPGGDYGTWDGTSFSTPFVSGACALILGQHPEWARDHTSLMILETTLRLSAVDIYTGANEVYAEDEELGAGRLAVDGAVLLGPPAPDPADVNGDGDVDLGDLLEILSDWSLVHTSSDIDGSGSVGFGDLVLLLSRWTG